MDAIWGYLYWHAFDLAANMALFLGVFIAARMASASQLLALGLATTPLMVMWAYQDPMTHGFIARIF